MSTAPETAQTTQSILQLVPVENPGIGVPVADGISLNSYRIRPGRVGQTEIHVIDRCFPSMESNPTRMKPVDLVLIVDIVGLAGLRLQGADRIPLGGVVSRFIAVPLTSFCFGESNVRTSIFFPKFQAMPQTIFDFRWFSNSSLFQFLIN